MKLRVWQPPLADSEPDSPPESPGSLDDCTPTRVTPSMSLSTDTKPATASCPAAQPTSESAGPATELRIETLSPPPTETSGRTDPVRLVNQTSWGSTSASCRITFSQSKRLFARLDTVTVRWLLTA